MPKIRGGLIASSRPVGSPVARGSIVTNDGPEPLVIGAIGRSRPEILAKMTLLQQLEPVIQERDLIVVSSSPLPGWSSNEERGVYWRRLDSSVVPSSRDQAWMESGSPGLAWTEDDIVLHSDFIGVWPVFYTREEQAIYFSNRLAPVVAATSSPSLDVLAWTSMLSTRSMPPGRSPVAEVSTMKPGHALRYRRRTEDTDWVVGPPLAVGDSASVPELIEAIQTVLAAASPMTLALSGGYDSRFLLACGLAAGLDIEAITADPDTGYRVDVEQAQTVAGVAGVEWEEASAATEWFDHFAIGVDRLDYMTNFHPWFIPTWRRLHRKGRSVVFGLGGGITLNDHLQITPLEDQPTVKMQRLLLERFGLSRLSSPLNSGIAAGLCDLGTDLHQELASMLTITGDPGSWQARSILALRTAPSIAAIGTRLTGPEVPVCLPHMTPRVLRCSLSSGIHSRRGDSFYQELIAATHVELAAIPTAQRLMDPALQRLPRRQTSHSNIRSLADLLIGDEVAAGTLDRALIDRLCDPDGLATEYDRYQTALHGAACLALFRRRFPEVDSTALGELAHRPHL